MLIGMITFIGYMIILGIVGSIYYYSLHIALDSDDASIIDPLPIQEECEQH